MCLSKKKKGNFLPQLIHTLLGLLYRIACRASVFKISYFKTTRKMAHICHTWERKYLLFFKVCIIVQFVSSTCSLTGFIFRLRNKPCLIWVLMQNVVYEWMLNIVNIVPTTYTGIVCQCVCVCVCCICRSFTGK